MPIPFWSPRASTTHTRLKLSNRTLILSAALISAIIDQLLKLTLPQVQLNTGLALGIVIPNNVVLGGHLIVMAVLILFIFRIAKQPGAHTLLLAALIISGSNLLDRIRLGGVIDYIQVAGWQLNLADILIDIVLVWYCLQTLIADDET